MKFRLKAITIALAILAIMCSFACVEKKVDKEPEIQIIDHNLSLHKFGGDILQSIATVDGKAKNVSNLTIKSASIAINFYDKDGNLLHTASTIKQNLVAGEIWQFNINFTSPDAWKTVRYDFSVSTIQ